MDQSFLTAGEPLRASESRKKTAFPYYNELVSEPVERAVGNPVGELESYGKAKRAWDSYNGGKPSGVRHP